MRNYDQQKYVQSNNIAIKMMSEKDLAARPRSMSAKPAGNRSRPISGMTINTIKMSSKNIKTELIASIYHSKEKSPNRKNFPRTIIYQGATTEQLPKPKKMHVFETGRSKQQLYEENLQLKREMNKLSEEMAIFKGKSQTKSKKLLSKQKQLSMEFQKEMYWAGSKSHMITGIKHQYEKLKKQYAEQTALCEELKIALMQSKLPEYKIYAESVEVENKRLADKLKILAAAQNEAFKRLGPDKQVSVALAAETQQNLRMFEDKLNQQDIQIRNARESLNDKDKKIQFLQQLIIQKDNKQYHMGRKIKKLQAQKSDLEQQLQEHKNYITESEKEKAIKNQQKQHDHKQQLANQQTKYDNKIDELNKKIKHIEEQNKVLQLTVNKLRLSSSNVHNSYANGGSEGDLRKSNVKRRSTMIQSNNNLDKSREQAQGQNNKKFQNYDSIQSKHLQQREDNDEQQRNQNQKKERVVQRADRKHSQISRKLRKVEAEQIKQIGQLLKYRMIYLKIDPKTLKSYFDYKLAHKSQFGEDQTANKSPSWEQKYITMKQVESILCQHPFKLPKQSSYLLSRYMIEDCNEQFVYCDPNNENNRQILKSIIKSTIGDYLLPTNDMLNNVKQFMDKYETNLQSALKTYYPSGKVSRNKLMDTINGLGVQISGDAAEFIVALACRNSKRIEQIQYNALFTQQAKGSLTPS